MTDMRTLGGKLTFPYGINDKGQIVGTSNIASGAAHAFVCTDGSMIRRELPAQAGRGRRSIRWHADCVWIISS